MIISGSLQLSVSLNVAGQVSKNELMYHMLLKT